MPVALRCVKINSRLRIGLNYPAVQNQDRYFQFGRRHRNRCFKREMMYNKYLGEQSLKAEFFWVRRNFSGGEFDGRAAILLNMQDGVFYGTGKYKAIF
jgi:hypothetical protein